MDRPSGQSPRAGARLGHTATELGPDENSQIAWERVLESPSSRREGIGHDRSTGTSRRSLRERGGVDLECSNMRALQMQSGSRASLRCHNAGQIPDADSNTQFHLFPPATHSAGRVSRYSV